MNCLLLWLAERNIGAVNEKNAQQEFDRKNYNLLARIRNL